MPSHLLSCSRGALVAVALLSGGSAFATHYYVSSTSGLDSNNGTSSTTPWKTLDHAIQSNVFVAGNTVSLMRGSAWYLGLTDWTINNVAGSPLLVNDFPDPNNAQAQTPIVSRSYLLNSGWSYLGSNHWAHIAPGLSGSGFGPTGSGSIPITDFFYDGVRLYPLQGNQISQLDATNFVDDASNIYVYAGPSDNPGNHTVEAAVGGSTYLTVTDSLWTKVSTNIWKHPYSGLSAYLNYGAFFLNGRLYPKGGTLATLRPYQWEYDASSSGDANNIYLYLPDGDNLDPNGKPMQFATNAPTLSMASDDDCTFENVEFHCGRRNCVQISPPTTNITFDGCRIVGPGSWGLTFLNTTTVSNQQWHTSPTVSNCFFDARYPATFNTLSNSSDMNGITLEGSKNGLVQNNYLTGWGHTGIAFEGCQYCTMEINYTDPGDLKNQNYVNYGRAAEVFEGPAATNPGANPDDYASTNNVIRRNFFNAQQQVSAKLWGQNNYYYSNIFQGATQTANFGYDNFEGKEVVVGTLGETVANNVYVNNVFYNTAQSGVAVNLDVTFPTGSIQANTFANNIFGLWAQLPPKPGAPTAYGFLVNTPAKPSGSTAPLSTDQVLTNNDFWNISASEKVIFDSATSVTGPSGDHTFTADDANTYLSNYTGNQQVDPAFVNPGGTATGTEAGYVFDLQNGSPLATSGINGQSLLGINFAAFTDYDGLPWASTPSVGAYQYTTNVVTGTATSGSLFANVSYWVGMKFTVNPAHDISVTKLGRWILGTLTTQQHTLKLVDAATGVDVPGGSTVVATDGMPVHTYSFAPLAAPVTLAAGHSYYLVSLENSDSWYDYPTTLSTTPGGDVTINCAVKNTTGATGSYVTVGTTGNCCGPVALKTFDRYTTPYATVQSLSAGIYNTPATWRGCKFTTGTSPVTIGYLGRMMVQSGDNQTHTLQVLDASTHAVVASTTVAMTGATVGEYVYGRLVSAVTLSASHSYLLVSQEFSGGDHWRNFGSVLNPAGGTIDSAVYNDSGTYYTIGTSKNCFGPLNMKY